MYRTGLRFNTRKPSSNKSFSGKQMTFLLATKGRIMNTIQITRAKHDLFYAHLAIDDNRWFKWEHNDKTLIFTGCVHSPYNKLNFEYVRFKVTVDESDPKPTWCWPVLVEITGPEGEFIEKFGSGDEPDGVWVKISINPQF